MSSDIRTMFNELAQSLPLPEIKLDKEGNSAIALNNDVNVFFNYMEKNNALLIYASLGHVKDTNIYKTLLMGNFFWKETNGSTLCLAPKTEEVLLTVQISTDNLNTQDLLKIIEMFLDNAQEWKKKITKTEKIQPEQKNKEKNTLDEDNPELIKI